MCRPEYRSLVSHISLSLHVDLLHTTSEILIVCLSSLQSNGLVYVSRLDATIL